MMDERDQEIRDLMRMPLEVLLDKAGAHLRVCKSLDILHQVFAEDIFKEIQKNNTQDKSTRIILPIGPTGQYPYLVKYLNQNKVDLESCWFFFMDEYCDRRGNALDISHPLSFKKIGYEQLLNQLDPSLKLQKDHIFFPSENNINQLDGVMEEIGGIDTCYGGIGIHGHLAFNEPEKNISNLGSRKVKLNDFTITINAIRAHVGGNLENFPKEAYTIGMQQILGSKRIKLYCRSEGPYNWAACILRISLLGTPGDDYPVTHIREHPNYLITTTYDTLDLSQEKNAKLI